MYSKKAGKFLAMVFLGTGLVWIFSPGEGFTKEDFPTKPIKVIVGYSAGSTTDLGTRTICEGGRQFLGQPVIVVNTPGASGTVALSALLKEKADGYNLAIIGSAQIYAQYMNDLPFVVVRDFTPVMQYMGYYIGLVVRTDAPWKTFKEFINYAKANPGKIRYGTHGVANPQRLVMEAVAQQENIKWQHIPYAGGTEAVTALLGGHLEAVSQVPDWKPFVDAGKLRLLVTYGTKRMPDYPDVPTLMDLGYNITRTAFNGIVAPKGTPPERVGIVAEAFKKVIDNKDSEFNQMMKKFTLPAEYRSPEDFGKYLKDFDDEAQIFMRRTGLLKGTKK